ncbi:MAG: hypothetical protein R3350_03720 [Saprospiraceae bacterium]|nr:hypothetical protein [Saprospiraceae bacterium]
MKRSIFLLLLFTLFLHSCKTGKVALEKGQYEVAVLQAVDRLRSNPDNRKARETLARAYPRFLNYQLDRIDRLKVGGDPLRWERILDSYSSLNQIYDEIQRSPAAARIITDPESFTPEYEQARIKAAEARYALAGREMERAEQGYREAAIAAYEHFSRADELMPGFRDARLKAQEARTMAVIHVLVEPIPIPSRSLELSSEFFQNQVVDYLRDRQPSPFVEFYQPAGMKAMPFDPDHVIQMAFDEFGLGQAYVVETVEQRSRDSVVVGTVEVVEEGKKVEKKAYGTVKATVHIFKKAVDSNGLLDLKILDATSGALIEQEKFAGGFTWYDYWGYFNGDERALTEEDKRRLKNRREIMPPPPQTLFIEFTEPIYRDLTRFLRNFYERY